MLRKSILALVFERYTEQARRVVFFARYEASQFGDREIGDVHLLLGLMREDKGLVYRLLSKAREPKVDRQAAQTAIDDLRRKIEEQIGPPRAGVATSVEMALTSSSKRILAYAAEEADRSEQRHIGSEHLMLGILREGGCLAASILKNEGIELAAAREAIGASSALAAACGSEAVSPASLKPGEFSDQFAVLEFVCGQRTVASVVILAASTIPRAREQVIITNEEGQELRYRVEDVSYVYEPYPPDGVIAPHELAKVIVRVSSPEQSQSG